MLICPQCRSENPDSNKFCQKCGISLSYKICPQCSTKVALNQNKCNNCGTQTGLVWWAIISKNNIPVAATLEANSDDVSSLLLSVGLYLDSQQRYQVLELLPPAAHSEIQCKVLDGKPLQISLLKADSNNTVEIGETAKTYLILQSQLGEVIPTLHDAWQSDRTQVMLLGDRSLWQHLPQLWQDNTTTTMQTNQLLLAMTELWVALAPWNACRSLLELSNLRVNAQGTLALQRLYFEPVSGSGEATLQELGKVWQHLFGESQRTKVGAMVELLAQMQAGEIQTIEKLQSLLLAVAQLPTNTNTTSSSPIASGVVSPSASDDDIDPSTFIQLNKSPTNIMQTDDTPTVVLPMQLIGLEDAGLTDVGGQRQHNEDCFGIETAVNKLEFPRGKNVQARGLYILCDGMGGHAGGEVASSMAVKTLQQYFQANWLAAKLPSEEVIREAVRLANKEIYDANQEDARSGVGRMGTTLVMVLLQDNQVAVAHVGDSRLYRLNRKIGLEQVTLDHEVGQREILRGVEPELAYARPDAYQLTQALGPRDENYVNPDVQFLELNEDTLFILASDGLSDNNLVEQYWQTHLEPLISSSSNLDQGVNALIDLANQYNGHDNITAVLVRAKVAPRQLPQI